MRKKSSGCKMSRMRPGLLFGITIRDFWAPSRWPAALSVVLSQSGPHPLSISGMPSCAVAFVPDLSTVLHSVTTGDDGLGGSVILQRLHALLSFWGCACSALLVVLLKVRGPHTRLIVANYQFVAGAAMTATFCIGLATRIVRQQRAPGSYVSFDLCMFMGISYVAVLAVVRLKWRYVVCVLLVDLAGLIFASNAMGLRTADLHRLTALLLLGGTCAVYLSFNRLGQSRVQFQVSSHRSLRASFSSSPADGLARRRPSNC